MPEIGKKIAYKANRAGGAERFPDPAVQKYLAHLEKKPGKGKALTVLAHTLARVVYYMWKRDTVFDPDKFFKR